MDPLKTGSIMCEARKKLNMTQKDLADKVYVSDKAVSKWERGICFPDISVLIPLTEVLGISLYDLLKGEKMNKKDLEETLKNTITYSNNEVKRKKKKYMLISVVSVLIVIMISTFIIVFNINHETSGTRDRDEIYDISYYTDYKTELVKNDEEKIEILLEKLPFFWIEKTYDIVENKIIITYDKKFDELIKDYNDEKYVKLAMINNSTILFTLVSDLQTIRIDYNDYSFEVEKEDIINSYSISSFDELFEEDAWENKISSKLVKDKFVNETFKNKFKKTNLN